MQSMVSLAKNQPFLEGKSPLEELLHEGARRGHLTSDGVFRCDGLIRGA